MNRNGRTVPVPAAIAVAAVLVLATVAALWFVAGSGAPAASPSPAPSSATAASASASPVATASLSPAVSATSAAGTGVKPDARHGVIVATGNLRTEDDPRGLQQPSFFMTAPTSTYSVSPDGKRIALIRGLQAGQQQIVTFTSTKPNDVMTAVDLTGSSERVTHLVWAGDGANSVLFSANKETRGSGGGDNLITEYSALRTVDATTHAVQEIARVSGQNTALWPLAWLPARQLAAALEIAPLGPVASYITVRGGTIGRTVMNPAPGSGRFGASRDGTRIMSFAGSVQWWTIDQPGLPHVLPPGTGQKIGYAEFRPGADEIGVDVGTAFEIWTLTGDRRVVANRGGFEHWRADGSAAIASSDPNSVVLIDPASGATTPLPGGGFPVADVVMF